MMTDKLIFTVSTQAAGQRVDVYVATQMPGLSRARIQGLLAEGLIQGQKGALKASYRMVAGDTLTVVIKAPKASHMQAEQHELEVIYEDADLVVINKPAGLVVHPGAGNASGTLANALLYRYPDMHVGDELRPGIVHRLDKETSGVMVCARNDASFAALAKSFKSREVKKTYRAFCFGSFKEPRFELITGHARHKSDRKRFTTKLKAPNDTGLGVRLAHSRFKVLGAAGGLSELEVDLLTGRTHQIRAHLADIHRPLVHDALYGGGASREKQVLEGPVRDAVRALTRHGLHAERLCFEHPSSRAPLSFEAPLPKDLQAIHNAMTMLSDAS